MGKKEIVCPHCGKKKAKLETDDKRVGALTDVKGLKWFPLIEPIGHNEWKEDWTIGIGLECKCGNAFFAYDIDSMEHPPEVLPVLKEGLLATWFCEPCGKAFVNHTLECPSCGKQYTGGA